MYFFKGQNDFFQTDNQPIKVRHLSLPCIIIINEYSAPHYQACLQPKLTCILYVLGNSRKCRLVVLKYFLNIDRFSLNDQAKHHEYSFFLRIRYCNGIRIRSRSDVLLKKARFRLLWKRPLQYILL